MKNSLMVFSVITVLLLSGCSKKNPNANINNTGDVVSIDESGVNGAGGMSGGMNGSSDGMKSIFFDLGDYSISSQMQNVVSFNANILNSKLSGGKVKLEGNCDEFGTDEYNYALGLKRAKAVQDGLVSQGINASQIVLVSFGESNPQCSEATDSCYAQNRRVDLHLMR